MSWTLDIIIILIVSLTVYFAAKNGFVKTAISASSFIIAILLTAILTTPVAEAIKASPLSVTVRNATEDRIEGILLDFGNTFRDHHILRRHTVNIQRALAITQGV